MLFTMMNLMRTVLFALAFAAAPLIGMTIAAGGDQPPVVVKLYTSQGCSSCPPADKYMGELSKRKDILGLTFHVDYWDYIGWKDPFALPQNTTRQRQHSSNLGLRNIFTPQMVVQGAASAVGSDCMDVNRAISKTKKLTQVPVHLTHRKDGQLSISIPASNIKETAKVFLVAFDDKHSTSVRRGENGGQKLSYYNVVRAMKQVGTWSGDTFSLKVPLTGAMSTGRSACAVFIQSVRTGRILGAAQVRLDHAS
ncbi:MAG: DUF1223 domain-containing protein [Rhodospirillales bacterium]|jgi:hypothetical protein